ncbi:MAG: glycosyltransferase family 4 protein [bacterium]
MNMNRLGVIAGEQLSPNSKRVVQNLGRIVGNQLDLSLVIHEDEATGDFKDYYDIIRYTSSNLDPRNFISTLKYFISTVHSHNLDGLINVNKPHQLGLVTSLAGFITGAKSFIRVTGDPYREHKAVEGVIPSLKKWILHTGFSTATFHYADVLLPVGQSLKEILIARGYNESKVTILPQPFDFSLFSDPSLGNPSSLRNNLGLPAKEKIVLFVGRLNYQKGADRLLSIVRQVLNNSDRISFCIVGQGPYYRDFKALDTNRVQVTGRVDRNRMPQYYHAADLLIHPSRTEGLPNVILEALASKLPVIASPVGEIPHLVSNVSDRPEEYVQRILEGDWTEDPLPDRYRWNSLQDRYDSMFGIGAN